VLERWMLPIIKEKILCLIFYFKGKTAGYIRKAGFIISTDATLY